MRKPKPPTYTYVGPPADVLVLPDGHKVVSPGTISAEQVAHLLFYHSCAARYWAVAATIAKKKDSNPKQEEE